MSTTELCPCGCGNVCETMSDAEHLIELAKAVLNTGGRILLAPDPTTSSDLARVRLAIAMYRRGPGFCFRAMMEGWNAYRITREMY